MRNLLTAAGLTLALMMTAAPAVAQELPYKPGDYWEVGYIIVEEGQGLAYGQFLASKWKAEQEFAKSKGWIKDYHALANVYARDGEPDIYLVTVMGDFPTNAQLEQQFVEYLAWAKSSISQLQEESAGRASIRRTAGSTLLQELILK